MIAGVLPKISKIGCIVALCIVAMGLSGCGWLGHKKPVPNPHPKYFVTITGNIQPHMPYPMTVIYQATYAAYHPSCGVWISRIEGVKGMAGHTVYYPVHPNAQGNFKVHIPIDAYVPGKCNWRIAWIEFSMVPKIPPKDKLDAMRNTADMIRFGSKGNPNELPGYPMSSNATIYCGRGGLDLCTGNSLQGDYTDQVLRTKSYHFIQNIKNQE